MTKHLRALTLALLLIIISCITLACAPDEDNGLQHATFYDRVEKYAHETYLQENSTHFPFEESDLPYNRVNVIRTQAEFDKAIPEGHIEIDFEKEILVLYIFTDNNAGYRCRLKSIKMQDNQLNIIIYHDLAKKAANGVTPPSSSLPTQRCLAIKTTLIDFDNASVKLIGPN